MKINGHENLFGWIDELIAESSPTKTQSPEQLNHEGKILVIDDSNVLGPKTFPDLENAFSDLTERGADVVIVTTDAARSVAGQKLGSEAYLSKVLREQGYGSYGTENFNPNVIACLLNYEESEVFCAIGDNWSQAITAEETTAAEVMIIGQARRESFENNQAAIRIALEFFEKQIVATEVETHTSTSTSSDETTEENVISVSAETHSTPKSEIILPTVGLSLLITMGVISIWQGVKILGKRKELKSMAGLTNEINTLLESFSEEMHFDLVEKRYPYLISNYAESYPEKAQIIEERYDSFKIINKEIADLIKFISDNRVRFYSKKEDINLVKQAQLNLKSKLTTILEEIDRTENESYVVDALIEQGRIKFDSAKKSFDELQSTIDSLQSKYSEFIPDSATTLKTIAAQLKTADDYTSADSTKILLGSDISAEISQTINKTNNFLTLYVTTIDSVYEAQSQMENRFKKWDKVELPADLVISIKRLLKNISNDITNGESVENLQEEIESVQSEMKLLFQYAQTLEESLQSVDTDSKTLQDYFVAHYSQKHITDELASLTDFLKKSINDAKNGLFANAIDAAKMVKNKSAEAVKTLETLDQLKKRNQSQLLQLSKDVASAQNTLQYTLSTKWKELHKNYSEENYFSVKSNFVEAENLLLEIFDNPSDENDLASQAEKENSMSEDKQNFKQAENIISSLNRKLVKAESLMDELLSRYELVITSEKQYQAAISAAENQIQTAIETKSGPADDMVSTSVDTMIKEAQNIISKAKQNGSDKNYVSAYQLAQEANQLAVNARKDTEDQIKKIKLLYSELEQEKSRQRSSVMSALDKVDSEADAVVSLYTLQIARQMKDDLIKLEVSANSFTQYEDIQLSNQLSIAIENLQRLGSHEVQDVLDSLRGDQQEHQKQLDIVKSAISSAEEAIQSAQQKVTNYRANSAGRTHLNQAIAENPSVPLWGAHKSEIERTINKAHSAKRLADQAYSIANEAIQDHIRAEEEKEKKRLAEEAEKRRVEAERQQRIQDAADKKRKEDTDRLNEQRKREIKEREDSKPPKRTPSKGLR